MATLKYLSQYFTTTLNVGGGIDASQTTGIVLQSVAGVKDISKPGQVCVTYSDPIDTGTAEWIDFTSINGSNELVGVVRGREGYSAHTHLNGATVAFVLSASHINDVADLLTGATTGAVLSAPVETPTTTGGSSTVYTLTPTVALTAYTTGTRMPVIFHTACGATPTINVSGLGDKTIKKADYTALGASDIAAGAMYYLIYDGTYFTVVGLSSAGTAFWSTVPGTPTRVSDTQFTITDTSNANLYDLLFKKGVVLRWLESSTFQVAMVISSSYGANAVTINLVGDSLTAGFDTMKYSIPKAMKERFFIAGTFPSAATTDLSHTFYPSTDIYVISADLQVKTAGSGTGSTVVDINVSGTTKFTTKPTLTTTGTTDYDNVADTPSTAVAQYAPVTIDVDSVTATTAPSEGYVDIHYIPVDWRYRT